MNPEQLVKQYEHLKGDRGTIESHWQECREYSHPERSNFTTTPQPGQKFGQQIVDSTAAQASITLAGFLHGMLTNPTTQWFDLSTGDEELDRDDDVGPFLQKTAKTIHHTLNNSNFQTEVHEVYLDLNEIGTVGLFIDEDDEYDVRFSARSVSGFVIEEDHKEKIDIAIRSFRWNAKQIAQSFGAKGLPQKIMDALERNAPETFEILHGIYKRDTTALTPDMKKFPKGFPIASQYVLKDSKEELFLSGFPEWPMPIPRWSKTAGEKYGRSCLMSSLPDVKMVNKMMETTLRGAQLTSAPPLQAPDDGFLGPVKTGPWATNFYRSGTTDRIEPIIRGDMRVDFGYQMVEDVRNRIRSAFFIDQLKLIQGPQMTATEVNARVEEAMKLMGPILARQQSELLQPLIDRVFGILIRRKKIEFPEAIKRKLGGKDLSVRYSSLVARAQRMSEGTDINRAIAAAAPFFQMDPRSVQIIDADESIRRVFAIYGLPMTMMRTREELEQLREQAAQAEMQAKVDQQNTMQAQTMRDAGQGLAAMKQAGAI